MTERPIVIGGCGRSGTTLLLSWLSAHPRIFAISEETNALCPAGYTDKPDYREPLRIDVIYDHLLRGHIPDSCVRWCEKTPKNVQFIGRILDYFGAETRFINIVRDGRDVTTSSHPADPAQYYVMPERWVTDVAAGLAFEDHPEVLTVRYEDLVRDTEAVGRRICHFLGEEFDDALLRYPETAKVRASRAWSDGQATEIHRRSVQRWQEQRHAAVVDRLISLPRATDLLRHYGYLE